MSALPPSLRVRLLDGALRILAKPRTVRPPDVERSRRRIDGWMRFGPPRGVAVEESEIGGVPCDRLRRRGGDPAAPVLLYLHGGAYAICSARTHRPLTGAFAARGFRVCAPDYRLAPEHPFPAALEDALAAYRALLDEGVPASRIALSGDSAGGGLCLALLVALRDLGLKLPAGAAVFSPWTDLAATGASLVANDRRDAMFRGALVEPAARAYLAGADPRSPLASPLYADLAGLPPLLIHAGETEILRDDAVRFAEKARRAGVAVGLELWPLAPHGWQVLAAILPEARRSVDEAATFLRARCRAARREAEAA